MALLIDALECVKHSNGKIVARCPACAEQGADTSGNHLAVFKNGHYGCCANPGDKEHRSRIFELAGDKKPRDTVLHLRKERPVTRRRVSFAKPQSVETTHAPEKEGRKDRVGTLGTGIFDLYAGEKKEIQFTTLHKGQEKPSQPSHAPIYFRRDTHGIGEPVTYHEDADGEFYLRDGIYWFRSDWVTPSTANQNAGKGQRWQS
jgi:hypothetical protein